MGALSLVLNGGGTGQLDTSLTEINKVFTGRQDRARHVLRELEKLVGGLDAQKQDIIAGMESMNGLAATLNKQKRTVTAALDSFGPAVESAGRPAQAADADAVGPEPPWQGRHPRVINASKRSLLADLRHLVPILREIANADARMVEALGLATASRSRSSPTTSSTATMPTPRSSSSWTSRRSSRILRAARAVNPVTGAVEGTAAGLGCPVFRGSAGRDTARRSWSDPRRASGCCSVVGRHDAARSLGSPRRLRGARCPGGGGGVLRRQLGMVERVLGRGYSVAAALPGTRGSTRGAW